jgi:hypothetical protein
MFRPKLLYESCLVHGLNESLHDRPNQYLFQRIKGKHLEFCLDGGRVSIKVIFFELVSENVVKNL